MGLNVHTHAGSYAGVGHDKRMACKTKMHWDLGDCTIRHGACEWSLGNLVVRASVLRLNGREFDPGSRIIGRFVLGWVTISGRAYHLGM